LEGTDLVVWLRTEVEEAVEIAISPQ
jgi:hypothetical protein